ncbi:hypothetical protein LMG7053_06081 [Achromobacter ruhlandii]|uniref:Uncharacterized protein n=1 Tax=Achromobacter ruhlandii TaxID=72557 RepID=A0ABM8M487_9BURK|nr:hypothetical protein LMG7053_06081 [Achromobacter ruhlandii]
MVPRASTEVVDTSTPACSTRCAVRVTSPCGAWISPVLRTRPAPAACASLPRVVEAMLLSDPWPRRMMKLSPAANSAWPCGVLISPALRTSLPASST